MKHPLFLLLLILVGCQSVLGIHPWSKDCDYVLPPYCRVVKFGDGKYGVAINYRDGVFQWSHRYNYVHIDSPDTNGSEDDRYSDSCDAKGMVKYYFDQENKNKFK